MVKSILCSLFFLFLTSIAFCQTSIVGTVIRIADGDTITLLDEHQHAVKIRLYGIDCPELHQAFGKTARQFTVDRCFRQTIKVDIKQTDRYGRKVGVVTLANGKNLNKELLKAGLAWNYLSFDHSSEFAALEKKARQKRKGLWSLNKPIAPWLYRKHAA